VQQASFCSVEKTKKRKSLAHLLPSLRDKDAALIEQSLHPQISSQLCGAFLQP
jgi:hypothetical protein